MTSIQFSNHYDASTVKTNVAALRRLLSTTMTKWAEPLPKGHNGFFKLYANICIHIYSKSRLFPTQKAYLFTRNGNYRLGVVPTNACPEMTVRFLNKVNT